MTGPASGDRESRAWLPTSLQASGARCLAVTSPPTREEALVPKKVPVNSVAPTAVCGWDCPGVGHERKPSLPTPSACPVNTTTRTPTLLPRHLPISVSIRTFLPAPWAGTRGLPCSSLSVHVLRLPPIPHFWLSSSVESRPGGYWRKTQNSPPAWWRFRFWLSPDVPVTVCFPEPSDASHSVYATYGHQDHSP